VRRLLGADSNLPATVIKPPPVHRLKNEIEAGVTITHSVR
jgi:hypothetical protein